MLAAGIAPLAHAAESDSAMDFGLVDIATGFPASGAAPPVEYDPAAEEEEGLAYARDLGIGIASYYGDRFAGRPTASGQIFDPGELTAAHRTLPFGSRVLVTSEQTGQSVVVTINDRGPYHGNRVIDLSKEAASRIGLIRPGKGPVSMSLLTE
jgi:rare lipoprotein A